MLLSLLSALALAETPPVQAAPGKGATLNSEDGRFSLTVRSRLVPRVDLHLPPPDDTGARAPETRATINTARLWVQGHAFNEDLKYVTQLAYAARDYRDGAISPLYDAYVDWTPHRDLNLKVGQYFVPFDRLRTVREFALQMSDRPRPVGELTLDRDVGVTLYSEHFLGDKSPLAYRVGVFGGDGIHATGLSPAGALGVARLELRPLGPIDDDQEGDLENRSAPGLALGVGAAYNLNTTRARSTTSTVYTAGTADYLHLAADLVFKWRGFAWATEGVLRDAAQDELRSTGDDGVEVVEYTRSGWGLVTQPSYMLTEHLELSARYARLGAFEGTDPAFLADVEQRANELALGSSVYLNGHRFKIQAGVSTYFGDEVALPDAEYAGHVLLDVMF